MIHCDAVDNSDYYKLLGEILESNDGDDWSDTELIGLRPLIRQSINTFHLTSFLGFCQLPTLECVPRKRKRQTGPPFFASCEELFVEFESFLFRLKNDFFFFFYFPSFRTEIFVFLFKVGQGVHKKYELSFFFFFNKVIRLWHDKNNSVYKNNK